MPRPPLPMGTWGKINAYRIGPGTWRAEAKYRDFDGVTRRVGRVGATANKAADNLRSALRDRGKLVTDGEITPDSRFAKVAELWLRDLAESGKATRTKETYTEVWEKLLEPAAGALRVADFRKVSVVDRIIRAIRDNNGPGRARHARIVLSGMCSLAARRARRQPGTGADTRSAAAQVGASGRTKDRLDGGQRGAAPHSRGGFQDRCSQRRGRRGRRADRRRLPDR